MGTHRRGGARRLRPAGDKRPRTLLEQGRQYTTWLYRSQYQKLWDRFSPDMQQTFGSVADLASFAGRAIERLGPEKRALDERVNGAAPFSVYQRTASFDDLAPTYAHRVESRERRRGHRARGAAGAGRAALR